MPLPDKMNAKQKSLAASMTMLGLTEDSPAGELILKQIWDMADPTAVEKKVKAENGERVFREAETVMRSLYYPRSSSDRKCKACGRVFLSNYVYYKHCSPECLQQSLREMGLEWDPTKSESERFGMCEPPGVIKPETRVVLVEFARKILADEEALQEKLVAALSSQPNNPFQS